MKFSASRVALCGCLALAAVWLFLSPLVKKRQHDRPRSNENLNPRILEGSAEDIAKLLGGLAQLAADQSADNAAALSLLQRFAKKSSAEQLPRCVLPLDCTRRQFRILQRLSRDEPDVRSLAESSAPSIADLHAFRSAQPLFQDERCQLLRERFPPIARDADVFCGAYVSF